MRNGNVRKMTEEEIQEYLDSYAENPDPAIRDDVVLQYSNLVESIARRFLGACEPLEDLIQEGYIGLIASVDKYDASKGVKFSTYSTHFIIGQIKHYLRDKGKIIKEPAWLQELNQRMTKVMESLNQNLGRQPTEKEVAEAMGMKESAVRDLMTTREVFKVSSLDGDREDNSGAREAEKLTDEKVVSFQLPIEDKIVLETTLDHLKEIEQKVINMHFYKGLNQTEIAKKLDISCNYVSHILRNGTKKMRKILTTDEIRDSQMQRVLKSKRSSDDVGSSTVLDPATGVYTYDYFVQRLDEEVSRAYRNSDDLGLLVLRLSLPDQIDDFVRMARTDDFLHKVGQTLKANTRKMDILARIGDMTFSLILPHTGSKIENVKERLEKLLNELEMDSGRKGLKFRADCTSATAIYPKEASSGQEMLESAATDMGTTVKEITETSGDDQAKAA